MYRKEKDKEKNHKHTTHAHILHNIVQNVRQRQKPELH